MCSEPRASARADSPVPIGVQNRGRKPADTRKHSIAGTTRSPAVAVPLNSPPVPLRREQHVQTERPTVHCEVVQLGLADRTEKNLQGNHADHE